MQTNDNPPQFPRLWDGGIDEYLAKNNIQCTNATAVKTGTSCYIWRLDGFQHPSHDPNDPVVLKCADKTPKYSADEVSPDRLQTEVRALMCKAVADACRQQPAVLVPRVLRTTHQGFIMTWAGETSLMEALQTNKALDAAAIGARIGVWLARLQVAGIAAGPDGFQPINPELGRFYNPDGFQAKLVRSAISSDEEYERVLGALRSTKAVRTLAAWDFRPMNNLLRLHDSRDETVPDIYIVDWELAQYGEASGDVAMWATEAMVLEGKHGDRGLLSSFLSSYRQHAVGILDENFIYKLALTIGVMLTYFMRIAPRLWGSSEEEVAMWRNMAVSYLKAGTERNLEWIASGHLKQLMVH